MVAKADLMSRVWPDAAVAEGNLSVTVATLRKALDPQADGRSYIQTVPRRGYRFDAPLRGPAPRERLGLAVLPFKCLGPETEAHLGLGMADALIGRLTRLEGLLVRPTGAVSHYVGASRPPREAAEELGVDAVVDGTIQRDGDRVRVSVQLVPRPLALRPWAEVFDAAWTDLFGIQDTVAERVVAALKPRLAVPPAPGAGGRTPTPRPEAYEAYLRGRYFWSRFDPESLGKAFGCYAEAAERDPGYAAPHGGLADAHLLLGMSGLSAPADAWRLTEECAEAALAHDRGLADAHVSRAYSGLFARWDWAGAREGLARAVAFGPGIASVHLWHGLFLALQGDLEGAAGAVARGHEADPLSGLGSALRCFLHASAGDHARELQVARRAVEMRPGLSLAYRTLGLACVRAGRMKPGLAALDKAVTLSARGPVMRATLAWALVQAGEQDAARRELAELDALTGAAFVSPCLRAVARAALGETEAALDGLEEGARQRDAWVVFLKVDPFFDGLRREPRFQALLARVFRGTDASERPAG